MKKNFIVSVDRDFWRNDIPEKVITDPFVLHFLQANKINVAAKFECLDFRRQSAADLAAPEAKFE